MAALVHLHTLALAQRCVATESANFTNHKALASALELARASGETASLPHLERTVAAYTSGQPWRQ